MKTEIVSLVPRIKELHEEITGLLMRSLEKAIALGELLLPINEELKHTEFKAFCKECGFSYETGMNYIRCFKHKATFKPGQQNYVQAIKSMRKTRKTSTVPVVVRELSAWETHVAERAKQFHVKGQIDCLVAFLESFGVKAEM